MDLNGWIAAHKTQTAAAGAGLVGLYALWRRHSSTSPAAPSSSTGTASAVTPVGYNSTNLDQYDQLAGAISNLNDQVSLLQASSTPGAVSTVAPTGSATAPAGGSPFAELTRVSTPTESRQLAAAGVKVITEGNTQYFDPAQLSHINTPVVSSDLSREGYNVVTIGGGQYFNPFQTPKKA